MEELLKVSNLNLILHKNQRDIEILRDVHIQVSPKEIVAVVGESGSGKSMLARTIMKLNSPDQFKIEGEILLQGKDINALSDKNMVQVRGKEIGIVFQEPLSFLNPTMKMGGQLSEPLRKHCSIEKKDALERVVQLLTSLKIADADRYIGKYPHQLSGGMAQRGMLAMAASCKPVLMIADEPTSALDVITQASIIDLLKELRDQNGCSIIFITHDLKLASSFADRVAIMSHGTIVESGTIQEVFKNPVHESTKKLLSLVLAPPFVQKSVSYEKNPDKKILLELKHVKKCYHDGRIVNKAVDDVSLSVYKGVTLGILGESGCGKSTLAKMVVRMIKPDSGSIHYNNEDILKIKSYPQAVQMVFQNPLSSLNPKMKVSDIVAEGIDILNRYCREDRKHMVHSILNQVGLEDGFLERYPHELSGGQRQRISIARALIMNPEILVADEPTSYLDVVSQAGILELFQQLKEENGLTYVFISHNLNVLGTVSDRIAVMYAGRIVEISRTEDVFVDPLHPYTRVLTSLALNNTVKAHGDMIQTEKQKSEGKNSDSCPYIKRCKHAADICGKERPLLKNTGNEHYVACHLY